MRGSIMTRGLRFTILVNIGPWRRGLAKTFGLLRSLALWLLGFPEAALKDAENSVKYGRETGQAASLMFVLYVTDILHILCGNYSVATAQAQDLFLVADEKGALLWKASGMMFEGCVLASTGKSSEAIERLTAGSIGYQSTGATTFLTWFLSYLTRAYAELGRFNDAWRRIGEMMTAVQTTKESWWEADLHRIAGEVALKSPETDAAKAEAILSVHSPSRVNSKQSAGNSEPP
jgi:predicted ATPase